MTTPLVGATSILISARGGTRDVWVGGESSYTFELAEAGMCFLPLPLDI